MDGRAREIRIYNVGSVLNDVLVNPNHLFKFLWGERKPSSGVGQEKKINDTMQGIIEYIWEQMAERIDDRVFAGLTTPR